MDSPDSNFKYHFIIADRILAFNPKSTLPSWFTHTFQQFNPGSLLRLYMKYQQFDEAERLAINLLKSNNTQQQLSNLPWNTILLLSQSGKLKQEQLFFQLLHDVAQLIN